MANRGVRTNKGVRGKRREREKKRGHPQTRRCAGRIIPLILLTTALNGVVGRISFGYFNDELLSLSDAIPRYVSRATVSVSVTDARALEVGKQWTRRFAAAVTLDAVSGISPHFNKAGFTTDYGMDAPRLRTPSVGRRVGNGCEGWILVLIVRGTRESRIGGVLDVRGIEEGSLGGVNFVQSGRVHHQRRFTGKRP
ncbi:hypothetical protein EDB84DRAFT_1438422 [Lactarius hengduanensis]|nr:hypothetical protein EDB84DRAFT_1438422 [Lactarius hengduanensis]